MAKHVHHLHRYRPEFKDRPPFTCSICGDTIAGQWGNNAQPINAGRCCDECASSTVLTARIRGMVQPDER